MQKQLPLFIIFGLILLACQQKPACKYDHIEGFTQGTTYSITFANCANKDYQPSIDSILKEFDRSLSAYIPNSIISRINANDTSVTVDEHFKTVFLKSKQIWEQSGGVMDITIGPITDALGFGPTAYADVDSSKIEQLLKNVGFDKVQLIDNKIIKSDTAVKLDVNSIAQGYSVDVVCNYLEKEGISNYMVEIGGEVRTLGKNPKQNWWHIAIDKPEEGTNPGEMIQVVLNLKNQSMTTSGNYRKFLIENGIKYSHIINPKTGFSVHSRLLSVTIVASDCITADGWDTAFMVMGLEKSIEILKQHPELQAYLIYSDEKGNYQVYMTDGLKAMIAN